VTVAFTAPCINISTTTTTTTTTTSTDLALAASLLEDCKHQLETVRRDVNTVWIEPKSFHSFPNYQGQKLGELWLLGPYTCKQHIVTHRLSIITTQSHISRDNKCVMFTDATSPDCTATDDRQPQPRTSTAADHSDAAARVDIAHVLRLRLSGKLTLADKLRLRQYVLQVGREYELPVYDTAKQKYYLHHHHLSGGGREEYEYFYYSPELQGVFCLACLLYAPEKVRLGSQSKVGVLVEKLLSNYKKIRDIYSKHLYQTKYHQNAVQELKMVETQDNTVGDISHQLKTKLDEEASNSK